jgi:deoxyribodipyrimidine photo-lyase
MKTVIVWYRSDLRVHDHPALATARDDADHVVPVFILNSEILKGPRGSANRNRFLLECLEDLKSSLKKMGADLVIRDGDAEKELKKLIKETGAEAIYYSADYTPYAVHRDKGIKQALGDDVEFRSFGGRLAVGALDKLQTKAGKHHKVFTPFWKNWMAIGRREVAKTPRTLSLPSSVTVGRLPSLDSITKKSDLSENVLKGGETEARKRLHSFLDDRIADYHQENNDMAADQTSRLSAYLHLGCLSPREIETMLPDNAGARAWHRQLCWRDFYHYVLFNNPDNVKHEFQERYRTLQWPKNAKLQKAWEEGKTGYPAVDAAMRQLNTEGWMHNRARLIVGSFYTKDLWLDWRDGEAYFYRMLIDGDIANNNGNWQWIASVGVDPAPVFRRMYNPSTQRDKFDPTGAYVRRYVPELKNVPDKYLSEPWNMPEDEQKKAKCIIGKDYPEPIVDHKEARQYALDQYRSAS